MAGQVTKGTPMNGRRPHGLVRQVHVRNYKSIAQTVVDLGSFTALVGPNGSGKSNFIDALAFVQECLSTSIELAFKNRGGIGSVRRRSGGHPTHIGIRLIIELASGAIADYSFEIAARPRETFRVARERCVVTPVFGMGHRFLVTDGQFQEEIAGIRPRVSPDRLALYAASATEEYREVFDFLTGMRFYSIVPDRVRELQEPDPGTYLSRSGSNAAAVLKRLMDEDPAAHARLCDLLASIVQGLSAVDYRAIAQKETLQFKQDVGLRDPWTFDALNMSDGTLSAMGVLLAVFQPTTPSLVAIEEPEATVHPAAAETITSVLLDAIARTQVVITTHSPDLLDHESVSDDRIMVVSKQDGKTLVAPLAPSSRAAIRKKLYSAGELLSVGELLPDLASATRRAHQLNLFGSIAPEVAADAALAET